MLPVASCRNDERKASGLPPQECLKPAEQRVVAVQHIVERCHGYRIGAVGAEKAAKRVKLCRRAVQRNHSRGGRPAERRYHAEAIMSLGEQRGVAALEAGADFPVFAGAGARASLDQSASLSATRLAWLRRITPSSSTLRPLAARVAPVVVMSTIISAVPTAGAPSVAPALSTMR